MTRVGVTVVIATIGRFEPLARCLDALLAGTRMPGEIVVVDQSRGPEVGAVLRARQGAVALVHLRGSRPGLGAAQNEAIEQAAYPLVAVTDDDCIPARDWIEVAERVLASDEVAAATGRVLPLGLPRRGRYPVASRTAERPAIFGRGVPPWHAGSGNNFVVRRMWWDRVGGADERLGPGTPGRGAVDLDLFHRLLRANGRIVYEPALLVHHEQVNLHGRLERRIPYGYGMGAACVAWLREGDVSGATLLVRWTGWRLLRLLRALGNRRLLAAYEEALMVFGTGLGVVHGARVMSRTGRWPIAEESARISS